ncbi:MAG: rod shape-determining protein [Oscillospiraceae bacterium]|jgi:rod shape-determining protein MreB|nr:rod shape-determining protein [Oscillospiraceae bacterium]
MSSLDIGIDLGTANVIITLGGKGIVINEPSVVAYDRKKQEVVAVGLEAYKMIGRTPEYIVAVRPLQDGVISDNDMTEVMIHEFIKKVKGSVVLKPQIILCVPSSVTDVEKRAVIEAALSAGSRKVWLIEEPIAALLGAGVDITLPGGKMVVDIGGGTADIAVVSFNGIVHSESIKMAGNKFDASIIRYVNQKFKLLIGEKTAEMAKKQITNVFDPDGSRKMDAKGRNLVDGLPSRVEITDIDMEKALREDVSTLISAIKDVFEKTPPELVGDILVNGIIMTGGGAMLGGLPQLITHALRVPCYVADNPIECVARGVAKAFSCSDQLLDGFELVSVYKYK